MIGDIHYIADTQTVCITSPLNDEMRDKLADTTEMEIAGRRCTLFPHTVYNTHMAIKLRLNVAPPIKQYYTWRQ